MWYNFFYYVVRLLARALTQIRYDHEICKLKLLVNCRFLLFLTL